MGGMQVWAVFNTHCRKCWNADYCNRAKTPTKNKKQLSGFQLLLRNAVVFIYSKAIWIVGFVLQQAVGKFSCVLLCADVNMCICQERLQCDMLLCCCGVGAPLGLSVLVCWFPAAQHFAGPQGDKGGTYDWAMQSWASHSYRSATDTSLWHPSVSSLSAHSSAKQQT